MTKQIDYLNQLQELYDAYTGKELEAALGVTTRSIQNYLKQGNPAKPGKGVIIKIREVYAKHQEGKPLIELPVQVALVKEPLEQAILNFSERDKINAEKDKINAQNLERLIHLLEEKYYKLEAGIPTLPPRGTPGSETLKKKPAK
jgi:predicted transcriptional regulator